MKRKLSECNCEKCKKYRALGIKVVVIKKRLNDILSLSSLIIIVLTKLILFILFSFGIMESHGNLVEVALGVGIISWVVNILARGDITFDMMRVDEWGRRRRIGNIFGETNKDLTKHKHAHELAALQNLTRTLNYCILGHIVYVFSDPELLGGDLPKSGVTMLFIVGIMFILESILRRIVIIRNNKVFKVIE